jgi:hypothetical protein
VADDINYFDNHDVKCDINIDKRQQIRRRKYRNNINDPYPSQMSRSDSVNTTTTIITTSSSSSSYRNKRKRINSNITCRKIVGGDNDKKRKVIDNHVNYDYDFDEDRYNDGHDDDDNNNGGRTKRKYHSSRTENKSKGRKSY